MALLDFKFIKRLLAPDPIDAPIAEGDRIDVAFNKLQGQINTMASGGSSAFTPTKVAPNTDYLVPEDTQLLFTKKVKLEDGSRFVLDGILVEVD